MAERPSPTERMNYNHAIKVIRIAKGIQQKDLAEIRGVTPQAISQMERSVSSVDADAAKEWAKQLEVPMPSLTILAMEAEERGEWTLSKTQVFDLLDEIGAPEYEYVDA